MNADANVKHDRRAGWGDFRHPDILDISLLPDLERIGIAESRRVRGLGAKQVAALEREFAPGE